MVWWFKYPTWPLNNIYDHHFSASPTEGGREMNYMTEISTDLCAVISKLR
jgi:hypothetical protein